MAIRKKEQEKLFAKLELDGEVAVRENIARGIYGNKKLPIVKEWLRQKEQNTVKHKFDKTHEINIGLLAASKSSRNAAWAATILAFLALVLSLYFYTSSSRKHAEDILFKVGIRHGGYTVEVMQGPNDKYPAMIPVRWKCQLVNNGSISVNLMKFRLKQVSDEFPKIDQSVSISENEQDPLILPFSIAPGKNRTIYISANVLINADKYNVLRKKFPIGKKTSNYRIRSFWLSHSIKDTTSSNGDKSSKTKILPPIEGESKQQFLATFETSRGNRISALFSEIRQY